MRALTVTHAFGDYAPGDIIADRSTMNSTLETNPGHVVAVNLSRDDAEALGVAPKKAAKADVAKPAPTAADPASTPSTAP